ncbi:lysozyme-like isoform X2 [Aricia agestis]|nr:lysozyme-like isoform X2 [Aricia agestis]
MAPTRCSAPKRCFGDFCGPFNLSKDYWLDAGQPTLLNNDPERKGAFEDCAKDYECAKTIVAGYLEKFVTDCNNDGVIDCLDHMMVNANGRYDCSTPLETTTVGRRWLAAYEKCKVDL